MAASEPIFIQFEHLFSMVERMRQEAAEIPTDTGSDPLARGISYGHMAFFRARLESRAGAFIASANALRSDLHRVGEAVRETAEEAVERDQSITSSVGIISAVVEDVELSPGAAPDSEHGAAPPTVASSGSFK